MLLHYTKLYIIKKIKKKPFIQIFLFFFFCIFVVITIPCVVLKKFNGWQRLW